MHIGYPPLIACGDQFFLVIYHCYFMNDSLKKYMYEIYKGVILEKSMVVKYIIMFI